MNKDTILAIIRHLLTFGGGLLSAKGLTDAGEVETASGAIITLVGVIWSIIEKRSRLKAQATEEKETVV